MTIEVAVDSPTRPDIVDLIATHLRFAHEVTPLPELVFAMDPSTLDRPDITMLSARRAGELLAIGAIRELDARTGEIKSMHTVMDHRGEGHGDLILAGLVDLARQRSYADLYLETGSYEAFAPARRLYARSGFVECGAFGDYEAADTSTFMHLAL